MFQAIKITALKTVLLLIGFVLLNIHFAEAQQPNPVIGSVGTMSASALASRSTHCVKDCVSLLY